MKPVFAALCAATLIAVGPTISIAQTTLVSYTFGDQSTPTTALTATSVASNLTAGLFSVSDGSFTSTNFTTDSPPNSPAVSDTGSWNDGTPTKYFSFTVTPASGYQFNVTSISFDYRQTSTGAASYQIDVGSNSNVTSGSFSVNTGWQSLSSSITVNALSGSTEFRIYGYGGSNGGFAIDQVTLQGNVSAIPEPSTYAAIAGGLALLGTMWWRRRQPSR